MATHAHQQYKVRNDKGSLPIIRSFQYAACVAFAAKSEVFGVDVKRM